MKEAILLLAIMLNALFLLGTIAGLHALARSRILKDSIQDLEKRIDYLQKKLIELHGYVKEHAAPASEEAQEEGAPAPQDAAAAGAEKMEERAAPLEEGAAIEAVQPPETIAPSTPPPVEEAAEPVGEKAQHEAPLTQEEPVQAEGASFQESIYAQVGSSEQEPAKPDASRREENEMDLETRIGAVWFNRIGLLALLIGFGLMGRLIEFQPWHKVAGAYAASGALFGAGWFWEERLKRWARPVMAGGLALAFFTSFGAYFLAPMQCISLGASLTLMTLSVLGIFACAERWKSESTAGMAIFLGHAAAYTAGGTADSYTLVAILFLCITALLLFLRHHWVPLSLFSVFAAYGSHVLWAVQDHAPTTPEFSFRLNFVFLASYYVIFLSADLIYQHRLWRQSEFTRASRSTSGRLLGPALMILFATAASGLFYATSVYWERIYAFYLPFAVLQGGLAYYHRSRCNQDYSFYAAAASAFLTLGLASWMDGLSLNMALAIEALILLILARRMQLWHLNPLAQLVLAVNFLHFWTMEQEITWPIYAGCMITAAVYFVKSRLEEDWPQDRIELEGWESNWAQRLAQFMTRSMPVFAYVHASAGAVMAVSQSYRFLDPVWEESAVALLGLGATIGILALAARAWIPAVWIMQTAILFSVVVFRSGGSEIAGGPEGTLFWGTILEQSIAIPIIAGAILALYVSAKKKQPSFAMLGLGSLLLLIPVIFACRAPVDLRSVYLPLWAIAPLAYWPISYFSGRFSSVSDWRWNEGFWGKREREWIESSGMIGRFFVLAAAVLSNRVFLVTIPSPEAAFGILSLLGLAAAVIAAQRQSNLLAAGAAAHYGILLHALIYDLRFEKIPDESWAIAWAAASAMIAVGILFHASLRYKRAPLGAAALVLAAVAAEASAVLAVKDLTGFPYYPVWLATAAALWILGEAVRQFYTPGRIEDGAWKDRLGLAFMQRNREMLSTAASLSAAFLLFMITYRHIESTAAALWLALLYSALLGVSAWMRRSASLAAGVPLMLFMSHIVYYADIHPGYGAENHPVLTFVLLAYTFAAAGLTEWLLYYRPPKTSAQTRGMLMTGAGFFHLLGFALGAIFLALRGAMIWEESPLVFGFQTLLPLAIVLLGRQFKLGMFTAAAFVYTLIWLCPSMVMEIWSSPEYRSDLLWGGLSVFGMMIGMERLMYYQKAEGATMLASRDIHMMRRILIVLTSFMMLVFLTAAESIQNYWTTFGWSLLGLFLMALGFMWKDKVYRRSALVILLFCLLRAAFIDAAQLETFYRMAAFLCLGACLIAVSYLYSRFAHEIRQWL
ncbi:MAG: DUF2339 domain-containing protein [Candidatus Hinthialibacter sp.]